MNLLKTEPAPKAGSELLLFGKSSKKADTTSDKAANPFAQLIESLHSDTQKSVFPQKTTKAYGSVQYSTVASLTSDTSEQKELKNESNKSSLESFASYKSIPSNIPTVASQLDALGLNPLSFATKENIQVIENNLPNHSIILGENNQSPILLDSQGEIANEPALGEIFKLLTQITGHEQGTIEFKDSKSTFNLVDENTLQKLSKLTNIDVKELKRLVNKLEFLDKSEPEKAFLFKGALQNNEANKLSAPQEKSIADEISKFAQVFSNGDKKSPKPFKTIAKAENPSQQTSSLLIENVKLVSEGERNTLNTIKKVAKAENPTPQTSSSLLESVKTETEKVNLLKSDLENSNTTEKTSNPKATLKSDLDFKGKPSKPVDQKVKSDIQKIEKSDSNAVTSTQTVEAKTETTNTVTTQTVKLADSGFEKVKTKTYTKQTSTFETRLENLPKTTARIASQLTSGDTQSVRMALTPKSLGTLHVKMQINGGTASIQFQTETPEAKTALEKQMAVLKSELSAIGIDKVEVEVKQESTKERQDREDRYSDRQQSKQNQDQGREKRDGRENQNHHRFTENNLNIDENRKLEMNYNFEEALKQNSIRRA
ncbi:MAG: hypothetical protein Kapaf2KO_20310 [Candidatus Kapaibacteriales bacterium]